MMNVWSAKPNVSPAASSFEKPSSARSATSTRAREDHEDEQQRRRAEQAELLGERRVDEVGVQERDHGSPSVVVKVPLPSPVPPNPPLPIE